MHLKPEVSWRVAALSRSETGIVSQAVVDQNSVTPHFCVNRNIRNLGAFAEKAGAVAYIVQHV